MKKSHIILITIASLLAVSFLATTFVVVQEVGTLFGEIQAPTEFKETFYQGNPKSGDKLLVLDLSGIILSQKSPLALGEVTYSDDVLEQLRQAEEDKTVKGIILSINSPGGSVVASDEIFQALLKLREEKPLLAYIKETGASGGYYISLAARTIMAHPEAFTGSIGTIMAFNNREEVFKKIGLRSEVFKSGPYKDIGSPTRPIADEERVILQTLVDEAYNSFVEKVATYRNLSLEEAKELGDGRIYSGRQALENELIDKIGTFSQAVEELKGKTGLTDPKIIKYKKSEGLLELLGLPSLGVLSKIFPFYPGAQLLYLWVGGV